MTVLSFPTGVPAQICRDHFGPGWIWRCQTAVDTTEKTGESTESGNLCTGTDTGIDAAGGLSADP